MNEYFHYHVFLLQIHPNRAHAKAAPQRTAFLACSVSPKRAPIRSGEPTARIRH